MILPKLFSTPYQFEYTMILSMIQPMLTQTKMYNLYYDNILKIIMMIQPKLSTMPTIPIYYDSLSNKTHANQTAL